MAMPMTIVEIMLLIALLGTIYLWFGRDDNNFTHLISGIIGVIFWFLTAYSFLSGIMSDNIEFASPALFFVFLGIGIVVSLILIVKILDSLNANKDHIGDMNIDLKL
jgi:hypothetical protein